MLFIFLPDLGTFIIRDVELVIFCNIEGFIESINIYKGSIHSVHTQTVYIFLRSSQDFFISYILSPNSCPCQEESLIRSISINFIWQSFIFCGILKCCECNIYTTKIGYVFPQAQFAICMYCVKDYLIVVLFYKNISPVIKFFFIFFSPPTFQVPILVVLSSLVIKSMSHFMANNCSDCSIINSFITI